VINNFIILLDTMPYTVKYKYYKMLMQPHYSFTTPFSKQIYNHLVREDWKYCLTEFAKELWITWASVCNNMKLLTNQWFIKEDKRWTIAKPVEEVTKITIQEKEPKLMNPTQPTKVVKPAIPNTPELPENNIVTVSEKIAAPLESIVNEFARLYEIERKYDRMLWVLKWTIED